MIARLVALVLLGGLCVTAQTAPSDRATILVSLIDRPVGRETYSIRDEAGGLTFTSDLDLTERGGRLQVSSSLRLGSDLTPIEFGVKGKSYRFVNVDAAVKVVIDPTLPWNELLGHAPETPLESFEPGFAHAPPALLANYRSVKNDTDAAAAKRRVRDSQTMVKALFDAGVPIVAGTDGALPGYSLLRSIEMYVEAGMTPMQAIESATRVPAESMGLANTGTIEPGKRADLIVLTADPLAQISNIRKLRWVVAHGRVLEPSKLWAAAGFQ
jgi:hypothetical protein